MLVFEIHDCVVLEYYQIKLIYLLNDGPRGVNKGQTWVIHISKNKENPNFYLFKKSND